MFEKITMIGYRADDQPRGALVDILRKEYSHDPAQIKIKKPLDHAIDILYAMGYSEAMWLSKEIADALVLNDRFESINRLHITNGVVLADHKVRGVLVAYNPEWVKKI